MLKCLMVFYLILKLSQSNAERYKNCSLYDAQESCPNNAECSQQANHVNICKCDPDYTFNQYYKNDSDYCIYNPPKAIIRIPVITSSTLTTAITKTTTASLSSSITTTKSSLITNRTSGNINDNGNGKKNNSSNSSNSNSNNSNNNNLNSNNSNGGNGYSNNDSSELSKNQNNNNNDKTASAIAMNQPPSSHHIVGGILIPIFLVFIIIGLAYGIKRLNVVKRIRDVMVSRRNRPFYEDVMMNNDNDDPPLI